MLSTVVELPREGSWGESLQRYHGERREACWEKAGQPMPSRIGPVDTQKKFNPLLSTHRDRASELRLQEAEAAEIAAKIARAQGKRSTLFENGPAKPRPPPRSADNVLCPKPASSPPKPKAVLPRRDHDILSNRYNENHEAKTAHERANAKRTADEKFRKTREFDAVVGRYYEESKEREFEKQRQMLTRIAGTSAAAKLPPVVSCSEGAAYDILSHSVKDRQKLDVVSGVGDRSLTMAKRGANIERNLQRRVADEAMLQETRAFGRMAKTAYLRERDSGRHRGYDVVSGTTFASHTKKGNHDEADSIHRLRQSAKTLTESLRFSR